jgi:hypothetical protein
VILENKIIKTLPRTRKATCKKREREKERAHDEETRDRVRSVPSSSSWKLRMSSYYYCKSNILGWVSS